MLGLVVGHGILQRLVQYAAVLRFVEVDEVDADDAAHVAQAQQAGDLVGGLHVDVQRVLLLGLVAALAAAAVHVDDVHGLGLLHDQVGAAGEHHLLAEGLLDLLVHPEVVEDVELAFVQLDDVLLLRRDLLQGLPHLLVEQLVVHMDVREVLVEQVAHHRTGAVDLAQHLLRWLRPFQVAEHHVPAPEHGLQVIGQVVGVLAFSVGADDEPDVLRFDGEHQVLQPAALHLIGDATADADLVDEGHEHHVAAGEGHLGGEARALGADGFLGDLHQDALAGADHIGDLALLGDVLVELPVLQGAGGDGAVHRALGELVGVLELGPEVEVVEEGILLMAHIDEGGVEPGGHLADLGEVDITDAEAALGLLAMQFG